MQYLTCYCNGTSLRPTVVFAVDECQSYRPICIRAHYKMLQSTPHDGFGHVQASAGMRSPVPNATDSGATRSGTATAEAQGAVDEGRKVDAEGAVTSGPHGRSQRRERGGRRCVQQNPIASSTPFMKARHHSLHNSG